MERVYSLALLAFLALGSDLSFAAGDDESKEPPLVFVVEVGGKSITITEGQSSKLKGTFTDPNISVTPESYRVFPYHGINFKYPRSFVFEADIADPNRKTWHISGNDLKIMYMALNAKITTGEFASNMMEQIGRKNCKVTNADAKITLGKHTLSGTTIQITVAEHKMLTEIYQVPSQGTITKLLIFQDSLDDSGNRSNEGKQALKELEASFKM